MFEYLIEDVFKITGRGYVLTGIINDKTLNIRIGEVLIAKDFNDKLITIKGIEMLNYGNNQQKRLDIIGVLVDVSDEEAAELKGVILTRIT